MSDLDPVHAELIKAVQIATEEKSICNLFDQPMVVPQRDPIVDLPNLRPAIENSNFRKFVEDLKTFLVEKLDGEDIQFSTEEISDLLNAYNLGGLEKEFTGSVTITLDFSVKALSKDEVREIIEEYMTVDTGDSDIKTRHEEFIIEVSK